MTSARDWYAWLIAPLSIDTFEQDYYEQKLCRVSRDATGHYDELLSFSDLDRVLGTHRVGYPDISLVKGEETLEARHYTNDTGIVRPLDVMHGFDEGATIVFRALHRRVPSLARLCVALGRRFSSRVQTNIYLTPRDARGFNPHWDTHDVFVLQVSGRKRWSIYDTPIELPLRGQRFEPGHTPAGDVTEEFVLEPGSVVYLPRGLVHSARSTSETSLHITLGLTAFTWADFLAEGVAATALDEEALRRNLPRGFASDEFPATERNRLAGEMFDLAGVRFDPERVWRHFRDEVLTTNRPLYTDLITARVTHAEITADSRVTRREDLLIETSHDATSCRLRFGGREVTLPAGAWPAVEFAVTRSRFVVRELPDCLDAAGKVTLVTRLCREGVLTHAKQRSEPPDRDEQRH